MTIEMSDADLIARLRNFEDQFVERKTISDLNDALKTVVAFCILVFGTMDSSKTSSTTSIPCRKHSTVCCRRFIRAWPIFRS
jgi:hypothetical protein